MATKLVYKLTGGLVADLVLHSDEEPILPAAPPEGVGGAVVEDSAAVKSEAAVVPAAIADVIHPRRVAVAGAPLLDNGHQGNFVVVVDCGIGHDNIVVPFAIQRIVADAAD